MNFISYRTLFPEKEPGGKKNLYEMIQEYNQNAKNPIVAAIGKNKYKSVFQIGSDQLTDILFIPATSFIGRRIMERTLAYLIILASKKMKRPGKLIIHHVTNNGFLCLLKNVDNIKKFVREFTQKITEVKDKKLKFIPTSIPSNIQEILLEQNDYAMANLISNDFPTENFFHYDLDGVHYVVDLPLAPDNTLFSNIEIQHIGDALFVQAEYSFHPIIPEFYTKQKKLFEIFREYDHWVSTMGIHFLDRLNKIIENNSYKEIININEAFHEKKLSEIARMIFDKRDYQRIVLIAGPSSSGKTTFSKRLSLHLKTYGLNAIPLSLDNYFVDRERTPRDENGNYDFESIFALDLGLLNEHLLELLDGKLVEIPHFDFKEGRRNGIEYKLKLQPRDILIIEGIHGLNDKLTESIPPYMKFKIYISPITPLNVDHYNRISSTDNRLLRRLVRDKKYRNHTALQTLQMWESVRKGEEKNIFPYQEEADVMFNSALIYELSVLKKYATEYLREVPEDVLESAEARRLLGLLSLVKELPEEQVIPPTSILREFIGGSSLSY